MDANKHFLRHVIGIGGVAEHPVNEIHDGMLVTSHEFIKCGAIARLNLSDDFGVWMFV